VNTFVDYFDNGRLDGWDRVDQGTHGASSWRATGHHLSQTSGTYGGSTARSALAKPGAMLVGGDPSWSDVDYSVSVRSDDDDAVGIVFRFQDGDDYYRFSMDRQRGYQRLVKRVGGAYTLLAENTRGYRTGSTYRVRVQAVGERLRVLVDGHRVLDVVDGSLSRGRVGLYTWGNASTVFDTLVVRSRLRDFFTVAVVPDTQFASRSHAAMLSTQMRWLAAHRARESLAMVLQEGDVVDDLTQSSQWATAHRYYGYLDGKVPFVVAGNHDQEDLRHTHRPYVKQPAAFNRFVAGFQDYRVDGAYRPGDYRNTYRLFSAGGVPMMVLNLDFGAADPVLVWAGRVLDAHPSRHVLLLTHDYLGTDNAWRGTTHLDDPTLPHHHAAGLNDGVQIWQKLVRRHPNVQLTLNGHVVQTVGPTEPWAVGRLVSQDDAGRSVYQVLTNFQTYSPGGQGYLRLFRFYPAQRRVEALTYSPYTHTYLRDDRNRFGFTDVDLGSWS
jgi:hypothetical protein